jgi:hypothetical protein
VHYVHEPFNVDFPNKHMGLKVHTWFAHIDSSSQKQDILSAFNKLIKASPTNIAISRCREAGLGLKRPVRFIRYFLFQYLVQPRVLVKDPIALMSAGCLYEKFQFKVICMIRNPFAFVGSLKVAGWNFDFESLRQQENLMKNCLGDYGDRIEYICRRGHSSDFIDRAALLWNILHSVILQYKKQYPNWLFLRHEDVAANPIQKFEEIFHYLDLGMDGRIRSYIEDYTSDRNSEKIETISYRPRDSRSTLQTWKKRLSETEIARVQALTAEIASQFYENTW